MRITINSFKEWFIHTFFHCENDGAKESGTIIQEVIFPSVDEEPQYDLEKTGPSVVEKWSVESKTGNTINTFSAECDEGNDENLKFNIIESVTPLEMMSQKKIVNVEQEIGKQENGERDIVEKETAKTAFSKAVDESKLVSLTVDSIKYYDKLRCQMPTDDLRKILDDVCRNLIDNLILSGCTPINMEPGSFDLSRHRVEPFQMVEEGTPYSKVTRKGVVFQNEVKLLAIVEL